MRKPFCADCGTLSCHVVALPGGGNLWLCGSCEMIRKDPEVKLAKSPPGLPVNWPKRRGKPQSEKLF